MVPFSVVLVLSTLELVVCHARDTRVDAREGGIGACHGRVRACSDRYNGRSEDQTQVRGCGLGPDGAFAHTNNDQVPLS